MHGADCSKDIIEAVLGEGKYKKVHKDMMACNIFIIKGVEIPGIAYMEQTPALKLNTLINKFKDDDELRGQVLSRKAVLKGNGKAFTGGDVKTLEAWADECGFLQVGVNQLMYSVSFVHVLLERSSVCMHAVQNACVVEEKYALLILCTYLHIV